MDAVLSAIGGIKDSKHAHKKYLDYLKFLAENEPEKKALAFDKLGGVTDPKSLRKRQFYK